MNNLHRLKALTDNAITRLNNLLFTHYDGSQRTPLTGDEAADKEDVIDYLNSNLDKQGVQILMQFTTVAVSDNTVARIEDIFEEGVCIRYATQTDKPASNRTQATKTKTKTKTKTPKTRKPSAANLNNNPNSKTAFIPFRTKKGRPVERLYLLAAEAQIKQGIFDDVVAMILPSDEDKHDFIVTDTQFVSKNMFRIYIKSKTALVQDDPGYAYRFELNRSKVARNSLKPSKNKVNLKALKVELIHLPLQAWHYAKPVLEQSTYTASMLPVVKQYGLLGALEIYKRLPEPKTKHKAQPIASTVEKRYYTLRQLKRNTDVYSGAVDVYIHDDTSGSVWAKSLQAGDKIKVDTHYHETIKEMRVGQPLFICDETSMPTVAAMLERWQHPTVPIVISITNDKADFTYFEDMLLPDALQQNLNIQHISASAVDNVADAVINLIAQQDKQIDCAWGAIGKADFRAIKQYLRDKHGLKGKLNRVRAYWV